MTTTPFIHASADVQTQRVGTGTRIWQASVVLPGARIGDDCNICSHTFVENDVEIGNRVTIKSGVQLWDGLRIEDDVFIGPNVTFTNDRFPRSRMYPSEFPLTLVRRGASIGGGATILPGIEIGTGAMIGAGAVVTRSVPPFAIVVGNPARITGYAEIGGIINKTALGSRTTVVSDQTLTDLGVGGATVRRMKHVRDLRGDLSVGEFPHDIPFIPLRYFLVFGVPSQETRGAHAHRECHQFLICVKGSCSVVVDDGTHRAEVVLDTADIGLHLPPMIWGIQYRYSADAALLVFASHAYDPADYVRDYAEFEAIVRAPGNK